MYLNFFRLADNCTTQGSLPSLFKGLCVNGEVSIRGLSDILKIIGNVVQLLLALAGSIAVIVILVSAVFYVTSGGDPGRVKKAKDVLINTVIGLVLILASYAMVAYIAGGF